jgi:hypothetical protein
MTNEPVYLLKPVFDFLDGLIRDQGDRLFMVFAYLCFAVIGWILSGGLRRKSSWQNSGITIPIILIRPPMQPPPLAPIIGERTEHGQWPSHEDDSSSFAA